MLVAAQTSSAVLGHSLAERSLEHFEVPELAEREVDLAAAVAMEIVVVQEAGPASAYSDQQVHLVEGLARAFPEFC